MGKGGGLGPCELDTARLEGWGRGAEPRLRQHQGTRTTSLTSANSADNVHISPNGSIITIVGTRPSNHGTYRCVASNAYGVAQSVVNLSVHGERPQPWRLHLPVSSPDSELATSRSPSRLSQRLPLGRPPSWPRFPHPCRIVPTGQLLRQGP